METGFFFADKLVLDDSLAEVSFNHTLLRGLVHKLNNHLAVIQGFSSLLQMGGGSDSQTKENLEHIKAATLAATKLGERALNAGGTGKVSLEPMNLSEALPGMQQKWEEVCKESGVPVNFNFPPEIPPITADPEKLKDTLLELVRNAAEASADSGGQVAVDILLPGQATPEESQRVDFFVRNTGEPVEPERFPKMFKPFETTKDSTHYGIGLTTAFVLASQMRMPLGVKCEGSTTTFWVSTPVA